MQLSDLDSEKYPHHKAIQIGGVPFLIAFKELSAIHLFHHREDSIIPVGSVDCTKDVTGYPLETVVKREAMLVLQLPAPEQHLAQLLEFITQARVLAESLRDAESAATRDNQPDAVGRELSYAIVKLREAAHWVRDASEIKSSVTGR